MEKYNFRLILSGFALLLLGIILALANAGDYTLSYAAGGLGIFFVIAGCFFADKD